MFGSWSDDTGLVDAEKNPKQGAGTPVEKRGSSSETDEKGSM